MKSTTPTLPQTGISECGDGFPITIWVSGRKIAPGLVDTVASNMKIMLNSLGVPVIVMLYFRMRCTTVPGETDHLFIAVDENQKVIRVSSARLAFITGTVDGEALKQYGGSITGDPLGALLIKATGSGERIMRFPPIFGFKTARGDKLILDRRPELEALRRDGYVAMTFLPIPGVDHRLQLTSEIASLWGFSLVSSIAKWPDLLILRNDNPERDDFGGVPDETWLNHALSRVLEDHLPVVEVDGLWMGSLRSASNFQSRARVYYAVLDWVRMRKLPYMNARTFNCYVRKDLSAVVTLGSLRDRLELVEWLESYPFDVLQIRVVSSELESVTEVYKFPSRNIAIKDSSNGSWVIVHPPTPRTSLKPENLNIEESLRNYYGSPATCNAPGSPITAAEAMKMKLEDLVKIVRIAECEAATSGVCILSGGGGDRIPDSWSVSHRAYRSAIRSHTLRTHETIGVYRMGPYASPFFAFEVHQFISMPQDSRYKPIISELNLAPEIGEREDVLLKALVGTVWLLSIHEDSTPPNEVDVIQVATDKDAGEVKTLLTRAWRSGHLIGTWCRVMISQKESLSVSVAGGTIDPLVAHAGDSIVDGNRWLDVTKRALSECAV